MRKASLAPAVGLLVLSAPALGAGGARAPEVHGHRGARAVAPENTLAGFRHALLAGADAVELDVRATADGVLVVHHDPTLDRSLLSRTDGGPVPLGLAIRSLRASALAPYRVGRARSEKVPTLDEVLSWLHGEALAVRPGFAIDVEVKVEEPAYLSAPPAELARLVVDAVRRCEAQGHVRVLSFSTALLAAVRPLEPSLPLVVLSDSRSRDLVAEARAVGATAVAPRRSLLSTRNVAAWREAGLGVLTWTVNDVAGWDEAIALGVDAIITDDPGALVAHLARLAATTPR